MLFKCELCHETYDFDDDDESVIIDCIFCDEGMMVAV